MKELNLEEQVKSIVLALTEYSRKEGIIISNKKITKEINIAIDNILIVGEKVNSDFSWYFDDAIINDESIANIAHDIAVERGEDKNFGICFYEKGEKLNYTFSASNDIFQITLEDSVWKI